MLKLHVNKSEHFCYNQLRSYENLLNLKTVSYIRKQDSVRREQRPETGHATYCSLVVTTTDSQQIQ
jgi:hypothetical protein